MYQSIIPTYIYLYNYPYTYLYIRGRSNGNIFPCSFHINKLVCMCYPNLYLYEVLQFLLQTLPGEENAALHSS